MSLLFPYLFPNGVGHYSLVSKQAPDVVDSENHVISEERGGIAVASRFHTFNSFIKTQMLSVDRRFARDPSFLFSSFNMKEKSNIHSAGRHTATTGGRIMTKKDIINVDEFYNYDKVTVVPHTISSSYAYKRKHYLDLKTICDELGPPQLFLTFSCHDTAAHMKTATGLTEPWKDPVFWRTRLVNAMIDSETFYYQQFIMNMPVYGCSFHGLKDNMMQSTTAGTSDTLSDSESRVISWRELYKYLVSCGLIQHGLAVADVVESVFDVSNLPLSKSQQCIFDEIVYKITALNDNMHWVLGGAGTGKSFLLAKFSVYFEDLGYQVARLSPTGIASYNIHGETIDRFFGMSNNQNQINKMKLNDHFKLFKKTLLFIDEFSIISKDTIEDISSSLIQVTGRNCVFGGLAVILFGDVGQLLPVKSQEFIWKSRLQRYTKCRV